MILPTLRTESKTLEMLSADYEPLLPVEICDQIDEVVMKAQSEDRVTLSLTQPTYFFKKMSFTKIKSVYIFREISQSYAIEKHREWAFYGAIKNKYYWS